jgi:chemotaxis protein MotA
MAITTIVGLILSITLLFWSISTQGGISRILTFIDPGSLILVIGCSIASLIINYTFRELLSAIKAVKYTFKPKPTPPEEIISLMIKLAVKARREGIVSLRQEIPPDKYPLLNRGVGLLADGTDPEITRGILETSASSEEAQIGLDERIWRDFSIYGPMFGMLGTLVGLVLMLRGLTDPSSIGPAMSLALITTFYGVIIAGIFCLPIAGKIHNYNERASLNRTLIIEGLLSIQSGDNSQIVEEKLKSHVIKR